MNISNFLMIVYPIFHPPCYIWNSNTTVDISFICIVERGRWCGLLDLVLVDSLLSKICYFIERETIRTCDHLNISQPRSIQQSMLGSNPLQIQSYSSNRSVKIKTLTLTAHWSNSIHRPIHTKSHHLSYFFHSQIKLCIAYLALECHPITWLATL